MTKLSLPTKHLAGHYTSDGKYHTNLRTARLIRKYGGYLAPFGKLPRTAKMAMVQYMAIDGEAWDLSPKLDDDTTQHLRNYRTNLHSLEATAAWNKLLQGNLLFYLDKYHDFDMGFIPALPMQELIDEVTRDAEIRLDYKDWDTYHKWYMSLEPKHLAPSEEPWPVILSSFPDETLQDGWTRFHQYAQQGRTHCPALWFPHRPSETGKAIYVQIYGDFKKPRKTK
jgi:hypothetical protein